LAEERFIARKKVSPDGGGSQPDHGQPPPADRKLDKHGGSGSGRQQGGSGPGREHS